VESVGYYLLNVTESRILQQNPRAPAGPEALSDSHEAAKYMPHPTLGLYLGLRHVQGHCLGSFEAVSRAAGDRVGESVFPLVL
jgi:hypothetical protein